MCPKVHKKENSEISVKLPLKLVEIYIKLMGSGCI